MKRLGRPPIPINKDYILERISRHSDGCWHWRGMIRPDGYGKTALRGKQYLVHRLAYCIWTGMDMKSELLVLHKCNIKKCCNPKHLYAGTQYENVQDYIRIGVRPKLPDYSGVKNPHSKLSAAECKRIEKFLSQGISVSALTKMFQVSIKPIYDIKNKRHWSNKCG